MYGQLLVNGHPTMSERVMDKDIIRRQGDDAEHETSPANSARGLEKSIMPYASDRVPVYQRIDAKGPPPQVCRTCSKSP